MSQTNAQWWAANFGTAPPAPKASAPAVTQNTPAQEQAVANRAMADVAVGRASSAPTSTVHGMPSYNLTPQQNQAAQNLAGQGYSAVSGALANPASLQQPAVNPYAQQLAAAKALLGKYPSELAQAQQTQYTTPAVTPTPVTPTPNPITSPVTTTGVQSATAEQPKSTDLGIPKGPGGFTFSGGAPGAGAVQNVSPDATYNLWKTMNGGKDNPQMQQYFNSGDWASVASGNIPMWMSADPVWRSFLTRLGYMSPSFDTNMQNAIKNRLSALQAQQTTPTP